jgi:hypothetical protein
LKISICKLDICKIIRGALKEKKQMKYITLRVNTSSKLENYRMKLIKLRKNALTKRLNRLDSAKKAYLRSGIAIKCRKKTSNEELEPIKIFLKRK